MKKLNIEQIKQNPMSTIGTEESLKNVEPYLTEEEVNNINLKEECKNVLYKSIDEVKLYINEKNYR